MFDQFLPVAGRLQTILEQAQAALGQRFDGVGRQHQAADRPGQNCSLQALAQEPHEMPGIGGRGNQADDAEGRLAAGVQQFEREALHAGSASGQITAELQDQATRGEEQLLGVVHLRRQFDAGAEARRWQVPGARIWPGPERPVELRYQRLPEASPHPGTRQREQWMDLLPVGGQDGSLASRFPDLKQGRVLAKTGTLGHVGALGGYIETSGGRWLAFSVMVNNANTRNGEIRQFIDKLVLLFVESPNADF